GIGVDRACRAIHRKRYRSHCCSFRCRQFECGEIIPLNKARGIARKPSEFERAGKRGRFPVWQWKKAPAISPFYSPDGLHRPCGPSSVRQRLVKIFAFVYNATHESILRRWIGDRTCSSGIATFLGHRTTECARRGRKEGRGRQRQRRRKSSEH